VSRVPRRIEQISHLSFVPRAEEMTDGTGEEQRERRARQPKANSEASMSGRVGPCTFFSLFVSSLPDCALHFWFTIQLLYEPTNSPFFFVYHWFAEEDQNFSYQRYDQYRTPCSLYLLQK
jgi:hypothetical protein